MKNTEKNIIFILLAVVLVIVIYKFTDNGEEKIVFPKIDDKLISELEEGHKTFLFDREGVLYEYISNFYPGEKFTLREKEQNEGRNVYKVNLTDENKEIKVVLKKEPVILNSEQSEIWTVVE